MLQYARKYVPENYFTWMWTLLKVIGLQKPKDKKKKIAFFAVAVPHFILTLLVGTLQEWIRLIMDFKEDVNITTFNLAFCMFHAYIVFRMVYWCLHGDKIDEVVEAIQRDTFEFNCFSIYRIECGCVFEKAREVEKSGESLVYEELKSLWTYAKIYVNHKMNAVEEFRKEKMLRCRMMCCFFCLVYITLSAFSVGILFLNVLGRKYQQFNPRINATSTYGRYPFKMYFPFDTSLSDGHYWLGYFYQWYTEYTITLVFLSIETVSMNSIIHMIHQVIVVGEAFKKIDDNIDLSQSRESILLLREIRIVRCITELQDIYRTVAMFEDLTNILLLIEASESTLVITSLIYTTTMLDITQYMSIIIIVIFIITAGQIFLKCLCCQALSTEFENLVEAICGLDWTEYSPKMKKSVLFLIKRVQKPTGLTAGKFFNVNLPLFVQVLQKSYSFYTLVSQTTEK